MPNLANSLAGSLSLVPLVSRTRPAIRSAIGVLPSGAGQTVDLPGPAAGFVRVYVGTHVTADPVAALTGVTIHLRSGGVDYLHNAATNIASGAATNTQFGQFLFFGETLRFTNGGNNTANVLGTYYDTPASGITAIRRQYSAVGVEMIPAAPAGCVSRFYQPNVVTSASSTFAGGPRIWNADAVAHTFELLQGGARIQHVASVSAAATSGHGGPLHFPVTSVPLIGRVGEAVNTTAPWLLAAYETFAL